MFEPVSFSGSPVMQNIYNGFIFGVIVIIAVFALLCLLRAIIGPRINDRVVAVNMIGTMVIVVIAIFSVTMESYLADICLIYAMVSFLAVIVLTKLYTGVYRQAKRNKEDHVQKEIDSMVKDEIERLRAEVNIMEIDLDNGVVKTGLETGEKINEEEGQ